jgi:hypothetical protein
MEKVGVPHSIDKMSFLPLLRVEKSVDASQIVNAEIMARTGNMWTILIHCWVVVSGSRARKQTNAQQIKDGEEDWDPVGLCICKITKNSIDECEDEKIEWGRREWN